MKKILLPLFVIILLTGCSKIDKDTTTYKDVVDSILISNNHNVNSASVGYKYYKPIGVNLIYDDELNKKFKIKDTYLYLYVDVISYFYKNDLMYKEDISNDYYYFDKLNGGYIAISKEEDYYFLKIVYNYAKIETYVKNEDLTDIIAYSTIILNSITYNDTLINNIIEKGLTFGNEITYEIEKPKDSESKFSQYLQEYVQDNKNDKNEDLLPEE